MVKAAGRDFAWTGIYATAVGAVRPRHCRCSGVDNSPGSTRCLLPTSKAVRYNKKKVAVTEERSCKIHDRLAKKLAQATVQSPRPNDIYVYINVH